jgi:hypothetical protein
MISIVQILIIIFVIFAWSRAFLRMRGKSISIGEFLFWSFIWIAIIFMAIFPDVVSGLSNMVGVGRAVDLVMYISVTLLFYLLFRLYVKIDIQSKEITKLVRELAIKNAKKKK